jgi:hypothetical protein
MHKINLSPAVLCLRKIIALAFVVLFTGVAIHSLLDSHAAIPSTQNCSLYASPTGSDSASANGTSAAPFATVPKLETSLQPGQIGCLKGGTYGSIRNVPGDTAIIKGWMEIDGSYVTLQHLSIDDSNTFYTSGGACNHTASNPSAQGLEISGTNVILEYDDIYQSDASLRGNLIGVGWWGQPDNTIIRFNKLHDAGGCLAYDHLIYLSHGNNVQIYGNWMWNDPHGWGIQVYPDPSSAHIYANVIDSAGSGFVVGNEAGNTVNNNQINNNVVMNSTGLVSAGLSNGVAISDSWGGTAGTGNIFTTNDSYNNPGGVSHVSVVTVTNNITSNPLFTDPANHKYTLQAGSPVASYGLWNGTDPDFGSSTTVVGDLNGDNHVDISDLSIFLSHWQQTATGLPEDLNNDGVVNVFDLSILLNHYGT